MDHLRLDLTLDFERKVVRGRVEHRLEESDRAAGRVLLHTRHLRLDSVKVLEGGRWSPATHRTGEDRPGEGRVLEVEVGAAADAVSVEYESDPAAEGLQWLSPQQTAERTLPFVYSQGQTNHNRSWIPCFDDPSRRITFDAVLRVPPGTRAVMAAEDRSLASETEHGVFRFHMPQPIPSYLIAMAAGDLAFRELGPRTGVFAEPVVLERAAHELADTERMVEAVEEMFGAYRWGRFDVLVLPPSFPLGGMENPRLTFATPTILAGDRSLVSLIAHELAHSWSGNLVTNHGWDDFWLNEGFTVYLERRIQERLYGRERAEMEAMLGRSHLEETIAELGAGSRDTWLLGELGDRPPDDSMTLVPYEKGYLLLRLIEETYGRPRFDRFLRGYFDTHAFETMTTERFLRYLDEELLGSDRAKADSLRLDEWVRGPGIPDNAPRAHSPVFDEVQRLAAAHAAGRGVDPERLRGFGAQQWLHFLRSLPRDLSHERMAALDRSHGLSETGNAEILCEWLLLSLRTGYPRGQGRLEPFLAEVGRRKFVKPLFEELVRTEQGRQRARALYARVRPGYHSMTTTTIDALLGV